MNNPLILSLCFGLGVILQAYFLLEHRLFDKKAIKEVAMCLGISLAFIIMILSCVLGESVKWEKKWEEIESNLYTLIFGFFVFFSISFAVIFAKEILPVISEKTVLIINLLLLYIIMSYIKSEDARLTALLVALIPTVFTIIVTFTNIKLGNFFKVSLYVWYLAMVFPIALFQFSFNNLTFFFSESQIGLLNPIEVFLSGATFLYLFVHILSIVSLAIPLIKYPTFHKRMADVREVAHILADKFSDYNLRVRYGLLIITIQGGILTLNYYKQLVPDYIVINISLLIAPQIISKQGAAIGYKARQ